MNTVKRTCKEDYKIVDSFGTEFTLIGGKEYTTSEVDSSCACHGPEPKEGNVVVFSKYWVSVPVSVFNSEE